MPLTTIKRGRDVPSLERVDSAIVWRSVLELWSRLAGTAKIRHGPFRL
jgi:hypothetical protein